MGRTIHWLNTKLKDTRCLKIWLGAIEYEVTRLFMKAEIRQNVQREQVAQGRSSKKLKQSQKKILVSKMLAVMIRVLAAVAKNSKLSRQK